jgi:hypothetical protein
MAAFKAANLAPAFTQNRIGNRKLRVALRAGYDHPPDFL